MEGRTTELLEAVSEKRFKDDLGHNLYRLLNEAKKHFDALNLPESFPKSVEGMVAKLHEADRAGTAFRYVWLRSLGGGVFAALRGGLVAAITQDWLQVGVAV